MFLIEASTLDMACPSPLRRNSRHQNLELISENTTDMNILSVHEESDFSKFRKIDAYIEEANSNNFTSPSKTKKVSSLEMNDGRYPLRSSSVDNGRLFGSIGTSNMEIGPVNYTTPGNISADNGRVLGSFGTSNLEIGPVNYTTLGIFSVDNGRDLRSNTKTNPESEPINDALPINSILDSGTVLSSDAIFYPKIEPINDAPFSNFTLDHKSVLRSSGISNSEIKPVNGSQPDNASSNSGRGLGSKTESNPEIEPVIDTPPGNFSLDSGSALRSEIMSNAEIQLVHDTPTSEPYLDSEIVHRSRTKSSSDMELIHDTPLDNSVTESNPVIESVNNTQSGNPVIGQGTKTRGRKAQHKNEYSAIRSRVRYLLARIKYEQTLIDAYSGEGWKGQSAVKVKPQKEIDRAKFAISKLKLQIRGFFQRLDSLLAEGQIDSSLFDSEGRIDSEDIYCAKCNSKDVSTDNDIILCDGMCVRGFHQKCLNPPLLTENIPPGDEGWLCPACECKIDCVKLLNLSLGSSITLKDTWEKVFPEAAEIRNGDNHNDGLPPYDCDYVPENSKIDSEKKKFTLDDSLNQDSNNLDGGATENSGISLTNLESIAKFGEEILAELDRDLNEEKEQELGKRKIERLDYNKLQEETCSKPTSDSSDDENWSETYGSSDDDDWLASGGSRTPDKRKRYTHKYKTSQKSNGSAHVYENTGHQELHTNGNKISASLGRNLDEAVRQKLHESYLENHYPTREEKESIAQKLGISYHQVHNWFNNSRRFLRVGPSSPPVPDNSTNLMTTVTPTVNNNNLPKKRGRPRKTVPATQMHEGAIINQIDSVAYQTTLPVPNTSNSSTNTEPARKRGRPRKTAPESTINQIDSAAYQTTLPVPNISNSSVNTEPATVIYQSSLPVPDISNSSVNTATTSMDYAANKSGKKEKMAIEIPLKEGYSIDQIDRARQKAIARELKRMKQGR